MKIDQKMNRKVHFKPHQDPFALLGVSTAGIPPETLKLDLFASSEHPKKRILIGNDERVEYTATEHSGHR